LAASKVFFSASVVLMSGLGAPFGTPTPTPDLAISIRLPAMTLPAFVCASIDEADMMIMS
jgi:hypothetical protein